MALTLHALCAASVHAASPGDVERAQREADRLLLDEQQRERERLQPLEDRIRRPSGETLAVPPPTPPAAPGACWAIRHIVLDGAALIPPSERAALTEPYEGKCIGLADINALIQAVTAYYVGRGYSTTRAYIPEQDLGQGELRILVIEGRVEEIRLEGSGVSIGNAFPGLIGQPFNLRDFEQGIDQINRLQSNSATLDIQPGSQAGNSIVVIKNRPGRRSTLNIAADNTGSNATGLYQASATAGMDDLLGIDDYLNISWRTNPDADRSRRLSRSFSAMLSIPYGRWTLTANASDYQYVSIVHGIAADMKSSGVSRSLVLRADRMMFRDQKSKWTLAAGLTQKSSTNYLDDVRLFVSSRNLTVADLSSNYTLATGGALWSFDLGGSAGLRQCGALNDPDGLDAASARAQFKKATFGISVQLPLKIAETDFAWQSALSAQFARDVLYGTEQFLVGSPYSVRGFRNNSLSGDSGYYLRNELGMPLTLKRLFGDGAGAGSVKPYFGLDIGRIFEHYGSPSGTLAGATLGVNIGARPWSVQFSYSVPVKQPASFTGRDKYAHARISFDF